MGCSNAPGDRIISQGEMGGGVCESRARPSPVPSEDRCDWARGRPYRDLFRTASDGRACKGTVVSISERESHHACYRKGNRGGGSCPFEPGPARRAVPERWLWPPSSLQESRPARLKSRGSLAGAPSAFPAGPFQTSSSSFTVVARIKPIIVTLNDPEIDVRPAHACSKVGPVPDRLGRHPTARALIQPLRWHLSGAGHVSCPPLRPSSIGGSPTSSIGRMPTTARCSLTSPRP